MAEGEVINLHYLFLTIHKTISTTCHKAVRQLCSFFNQYGRVCKGGAKLELMKLISYFQTHFHSYHHISTSFVSIQYNVNTELPFKLRGEVVPS